MINLFKIESIINLRFENIGELDDRGAEKEISLIAHFWRINALREKTELCCAHN